MTKLFKLFALIVAAAMMVSACACSGGNTSGDEANTTPEATSEAANTESQKTEGAGETTETQETETDATEAAETQNVTGYTGDIMGKPFDNDSDMAVVIDGKWYPVRVDSAEVLSVLGDDCKKDETISCVYDGYDKTFTYDGIVVSTVPDGGVDIVEMFTITGGDYTTTRNIGVGATRDEVIAAYGENYWDDGYLTYTESGDENNISEMRIQFLLENDVVTEINIYSPSYSN